MEHKRLGHYTLEQELGAGGMGTVYLATDTRLGRKVALKVLPAEMARSPERRHRFEREARAVATLNHPNIVTIHSVEQADDVHFITMELVQGQRLTDLIPGTGLPCAELLRLAIPLTEAVHAAHRQGITHRDLKPDNVMVTPEGWIKVLDFGLAKQTDRDAVGLEATVVADGTPTQEGLILGTVAYMSPEQAEGKPVDRRSDIFSLGIVLYEMATGNRPFQGESRISTLSSILRDTPLRANEVKREVPSHLAHVIDRCLAKEPDRRYQTALDVRNELESLKREQDSGSAVGLASGSVVPEAAPDRKMIVILPFENLGAPGDEYFAAGITEEITSRLAAVSGLGVISRTTAVQYDRRGKTVKDIGRDLGVGHVLEGTVRWARRGETSRVRVTPQLIRVSDDSHLWSDRYDRDLDDIFEVQSEIAEQVIEQLNVTLLEPERDALSARPTGNLEAYQAYLRGLDYAGRPDYSEANFRNAVRMFERAVQLDPEFALAHSALSRFHARLYWFGYDRIPERIETARNAAERALALDPDLPDAHFALGEYYYSGPRDYDRALVEYRTARERMPNRADLIHVIAAVLRRQGKFEECLQQLHEAIRLAPQDATYAFDLGVSYTVMHRYQEAENSLMRSTALAPDQAMAYSLLALNRMIGWGDMAGAERHLAGIPDAILGGVEPPWVTFYLYARRFAELPKYLKRIRRSVLEEQAYYQTADQILGMVAHHTGNAEGARVAFEAALDHLEAESSRRPQDHRVLMSLGMVRAYLGRAEEAVEVAEQAVSLLPRSRDAFVGPELEEGLAMVYGLAGRPDAALDLLEDMLGRPGYTTRHTLRLDPRWDPLRDHPRFRALVAGDGA